MRKALFALFLLFSARPLLAQAPPEGIWQGYDGEWHHVSSQLLALAEAVPEEKFAWRPAPGVRSTSEVFMHNALANFYLLSVTGDRKSTRLNSSHRCISYAVFCLKKKRNSIQKHTRTR